MTHSDQAAPGLARAAVPHVRRDRQRYRTLIKLGGIAALALVLLVPLALLLPVVRERMELRDGAVREMQQAWGAPQTIIGPVVVVPVAVPDRPGSAPYVYVLPEELVIDGTLVPEERARGIYHGVVYSAKLSLSGSFRFPTAGELDVPPEQVRWDQAFVALAVPDLRGVNDTIYLRWGETHIAFQSGSGLDVLASGIRAPVPPPSAASTVAFAVDLPVRGSVGMSFAPLGARDNVTLRSAWPNPRFGGAFLPTRRDVGATGFSASWLMSHYGRPFGQLGRGPLPLEDIVSSAFGVDLLVGIDAYRSVERATKYGVLVVVFVFLCFFLFEAVAGVRVHPFQYAMVGLAVAIFFVLLLAVSEVVAFPLAYAGAAAATTLLISFYARSVLRSGRRTLAIAAALGSSFGLLYFILQAEDYALLAGSVAVFAALAVAMRLTRRIDWYAEDGVAAPAADT
jgi:inner membrane protein